jgi:hypothetical protein
MATNIGSLDIGLLVVFFGGVVSFFRGFRIYREYLLLQGTAEIPIRSMAMGLVRIHGKAVGDRLLTSPISHTPCCVYQVHIEKWRDEDENIHQSAAWLHYGSGADGTPFYLEDSTGHTLVDARGAEYDIESTAIREASSAKPSSVVVNGTSEVDLLSYVARVGPSEEAPGSRHNLEAEQLMFNIPKYAKQGATPDEMMLKLFPQVMQGEGKMLQALQAEGPYADPLREESRLAQIELYQHPVWSKEYAEGLKRVTKLQAQVRQNRSGYERIAPVPLTPPALPDHPVPVLPVSDQPVPPPAPTAEEIVASIDGVPTAHGRYRFTERCILPSHEYDITGTCTENPVPKDANDRNLIRKGTKEPTFLISALAQPQVNTMLQMRAYFMIFGGGMLAVFCLAFLLLRLGQF